VDPDTSEHSVNDGWDWFEASRDLKDMDNGEVLRAFARCFSGSDGAYVLDHLRRTVLDRRLGPDASDASLRFLEGQRSIVAHILTMIERGQA